jgi:hypothetical protein
MVLQVSIESFTEELKQHLQTNEVYLDSGPEGTVVTASQESCGFVLYASTDAAPEQVHTMLKENGLSVHQGRWHDVAIPEDQLHIPPYSIAAVAYHSAEEKPGLWVNVYSTEPAPIEVLHHLYEEFLATGEMSKIEFEDFIRITKPNVVLLSPQQIESFLRRQKSSDNA